MTLFRSYCWPCCEMRSFLEGRKVDDNRIIGSDGRALWAECQNCGREKRVVRAKQHA